MVLCSEQMQWEKVKPKGRCQCHAGSDGEGQSPNYLFHGVTLYSLCWNCQNSARKSVIAITFWSFLGLRLRQANEVGGDGRAVTQYICDDHHSDLPGSAVCCHCTVFRHRRCISSQLGAAESAAPFFVSRSIFRGWEGEDFPAQSWQ